MDTIHDTITLMGGACYARLIVPLRLHERRHVDVQLVHYILGA